MNQTNLLFILSDQHIRDNSGCYGHPLVQTPNIDTLAERGTRFTNAYTPSPVCVPARACLATGRYAHQIGSWSNAFPYDGRVPSWGHRLKSQGHQIDSIGKLHFRSNDDDNGFTQEINPMYVMDGWGDLLHCLRHKPVFRYNRHVVQEAGPGDSSYLRYDTRNADHACHWLTQYANDGKPWVLFLSFVCPHPPHIAPEELYNLYPLDQIPLMPQWQHDQWPDHPAINYLRRYFDYDTPFTEAELRNLSAAYYGCCTYLDQKIGQVLERLEELNLSDTTRIIYTSDHGESLGARGFIGKLTMYEESVAVPFIMAGPDVPQGKVVNTPISLIDCFPTVLEAVGASPVPEDDNLQAESLWQIAQQPDQERTIFSEIHGITNSAYMLRRAQYKYVYYVNAPAQLFNLHTDPEERNNLAPLPQFQPIPQDFEVQLRHILDPEATAAQVIVDQQAKVEAFGGEAAVRKQKGFTNSPIPGG